MPIKPLANVLDAVFLVRAGGDWMERLRASLTELSLGRPGRDRRELPDRLKVAVHMDELEQRMAGALRWDVVLERGAARPGGVGTAGRLYADMVEMGGRLPRYEWNPLYVTADLFNPGNEAGEVGRDPELEAVELLAHSNQLFPWQRGFLLDGSPINPRDPSCYAKMAAYGAAFGELVARWCETLEPVFACADLKNAATFWTRAVAGMSPAEARAVRFWDYLWPISYWSPALLAEKPGLAEKLAVLQLGEAELAKVEPFERTGVKVTARRLATGGLFVQYRNILGGEGRTSRGTVDAPLAARAGLKALP